MECKKFFWLERNRKYCLLTHYSLSTRKKMRLGLFIVDLMIFFFYLGKGMIKAKINADLEIFKNRKIIRRRYRELEKIKTVPDKVLIEKFADTIFIPEDVSNELTGKLFNRMLGLITRYTKKRLSFS